MILFLYGEDDFRSQQKLEKIIARYKEVHKTGLNLKFFDFQKDSFEDFNNQFRTRSMFKEKKLFILKNAFLNIKFKENFKKIGKDFSNSKDIVLFYEKKGFKKGSFLNFLNKISKSEEFVHLEPRKLDSWIRKEAEGLGAGIEREARVLLIEFLGNNLWQLSNGIQKLANYKWNPKKTEITKKDVEFLIPQKIELEIFKTIDFVAKKQKAKALILLKNHLEKGDSPLYLLSMLDFQFRNLLMIKEVLESGKDLGTATKKLGLHPYTVKKSLYLCQKFNFEELKKILEKIFQTDLRIKTGKIDAGMALDLLVAQI